MPADQANKPDRGLPAPTGDESDDLSGVGLLAAGVAGAGALALGRRRDS